MQHVALSLSTFIADVPSFLADKAGLALVANIEPKEYSKLAHAMASLVEVGGSDGTTYVWGFTAVRGQVYRDTIWIDRVGLYVHVSGMVVSFLLKGDESAKLAFWGDLGHQAPTQISANNTLEEALGTLLRALGVSSSSELKRSLSYTHFSYPEAIGLTLVAMYTSDMSRTITVRIPQNTAVYEASYNSLNWVCCGKLVHINLDGHTSASVKDRLRQIGRLPSFLAGTDHKLVLGAADPIWGRAAFVLVWGAK